MPKVTFYTHVARPAAFACRLAARAVRESRVLIWSDSLETIMQLDRDLWQPPEQFLPHEIWQTEDAIPSETPLLLASGIDLPHLPADMTVLNLSPDFWHTAEPTPARILEIISDNLEDLADARLRFQAYRKHGFDIEHFDMHDKA